MLVEILISTIGTIGTIGTGTMLDTHSSWFCIFRKLRECFAISIYPYQCFHEVVFYNTVFISLQGLFEINTAASVHVIFLYGSSVNTRDPWIDSCTNTTVNTLFLRSQQFFLEIMIWRLDISHRSWMLRSTALEKMKIIWCQVMSYHLCDTFIFHIHTVITVKTILIPLQGLFGMSKCILHVLLS